MCIGLYFSHLGYCEMKVVTHDITKRSVRFIKNANYY